MENVLKYKIPLLCQTSLFNKRVFNNIRFEEHLFRGGTEDRLFLMEVIAKGFTMAYIDNIHCRYNVHEGCMSLNYPKPLEIRVERYKELIWLYEVALQRLSFTRAQERLIRKEAAHYCFWQLGYNCYRALKDYKNMRECFLKAIKLDPFNLSQWKTYLVQAIAHNTK